MPTAGVVGTYPSLQWRHWRALLHVAAGPASNILVLIATLAIADRVPSSHATNVAISASLVAQCLALVSILLPRRAMLYERVVASDGLQLLQLLLSKEDGTIFRQNYEGLLRQFLPPGRPLPTFTARSEEIAWLVLSRFGSTQEIAPETVAALEKLLTADLPACEEIVVLDALVTSTLASTDPARDAKLDRWSERAHALAPDIPTLAGSRGSALIEIGRVEDGLAVLSKAEDGKAFNDCLVHAFRALGHFKLEQAEAAKAGFARAKTLFKHEEWQGAEIERIVERISRTIGEELDWPSAWSRADAALRN